MTQSGIVYAHPICQSCIPEKSERNLATFGLASLAPDNSLCARTLPAEYQTPVILTDKQYHTYKHTNTPATICYLAKLYFGYI